MLSSMTEERLGRVILLSQTLPVSKNYMTIVDSILIQRLINVHVLHASVTFAQPPLIEKLVSSGNVCLNVKYA